VLAVRLLLALVATAAVAAVAASSAAPAATGPTPSIRVTFSGIATGRFVDTERWVLLSAGDCYLRRLRDQSTSVTWTTVFSGGRALAARSAAAVSGGVKGTMVKDSCDDVAEELPPDAPADWLSSVNCNDRLSATRPGSAVWSGGVLRVQGPTLELSKRAVCSVVPRSDELNVRIPLPVSRVAQLKRGGRLQIVVGTDRRATGTYRPRAACTHIAKPYDGYRSFDACVDTLSWSGTITVTRL
jgi:hypothetical protein